MDDVKQLYDALIKTAQEASVFIKKGNAGKAMEKIRLCQSVIQGIIEKERRGNDGK